MQASRHMKAVRPIRPNTSIKAGWSWPSLPSLPQLPQIPSFGGPKRIKRPDLVEELLELVDDQERGLVSSKMVKREAKELVRAMQAELGGETAVASRISATWKLQWTTEQETLFIVQNAFRFGTEAGDIYQVIDLDGKRLQNVITFPPEGCFVVDSSLQVAGPQRVLFNFTGAKLVLPNNKAFNLPPFGKGWFDNVYVDDEIRVALDVRDDVLICRRDGPPRVFGLPPPPPVSAEEVDQEVEALLEGQEGEARESGSVQGQQGRALMGTGSTQSAEERGEEGDNVPPKALPGRK